MARQAARLRKLNLVRLIHDCSGQDLIEYALVAACIGLLAVASTNGVATTVGQMLITVGNTFTSSI